MAQLQAGLRFVIRFGTLLYQNEFSINWVSKLPCDTNNNTVFTFPSSAACTTTISDLEFGAGLLILAGMPLKVASVMKRSQSCISRYLQYFCSSKSEGIMR